MKNIKVPYLSKNEIIESIQNEDYVSGLVAVSLDDMIDSDLEHFNDLISDRLTGSTLLMDITYEAVGIIDGNVLLSVTGDPSEILTVPPKPNI